MSERLQSRKFWLCLMTMVVIVVVGAVVPDFDPELLDRMIVVALGWSGIEGAKEVVREARRKIDEGACQKR